MPFAFTALGWLLKSQWKRSVTLSSVSQNYICMFGYPYNYVGDALV